MDFAELYNTVIFESGGAYPYGTQWFRNKDYTKRLRKNRPPKTLTDVHEEVYRRWRQNPANPPIILGEYSNDYVSSKHGNNDWRSMGYIWDRAGVNKLVWFYFEHHTRYDQEYRKIVDTRHRGVAAVRKLIEAYLKRTKHIAESLEGEYIHDDEITEEHIKELYGHHLTPEFFDGLQKFSNKR